MSIFGKILIITNLLVTMGFVYLASVDWAKRATWAYAVYRDDLRINGLPIDDEEIDPIGGDPLVDHLSEGTRQQIFQHAGGNPVSTQVEEVKRVKAELQSAINGIADEPTKRATLKLILLPLARTSGDRYAVQERIDDAKVPMDELMADVNSLFDEVSGESQGGVKRPIIAQLLPRDRRQAITHLLYNIKPQEEAHARLIVIVGLKAFNEEAKLQADNLEIIADTVRYAMLGDRANFEVEYRRILDDIRDVAESIGGRVTYYEDQVKLKKDHTALREGRQKDVDDAKAALKEARDKMRKNLKDQAEQEQSLFESQRILGSTATENEKKEREIRIMERAKTK